MASGDDKDKEITEIAVAVILLEENLLTELDETLKASGLWKGKRFESVRALVQLAFGHKGEP